MFDFRKLATMTPNELAWLAPGPLTVTAAPRVGIGSDGDQYETPPINASATAAAIVTAAKLARSGGPMMPKPSTVAQQILDAGEKRRAGG